MAQFDCCLRAIDCGILFSIYFAVFASLFTFLPAARHSRERSDVIP